MKTRNGEDGFALLFIYAMAAAVAVMLYMELPRAAFEAQRDKEQLLIDRGEQYSRAIGLYVRKFNRYPADFNALENTQNLRFLRRQYVDPMTGKAEWRIIHVGPGGIFTDSLLYTKKKDEKAGEAQTFITEMQQTGGNPGGQAPQGVNLATRTRPSDQPGAPGDPNNPPPPQVDLNNNPLPGQPGSVPGPVQVLPDGRIVPVQQPFQLAPGADGQPVPVGTLFPGGANVPPGFQTVAPGGQLPPGVALPPGVTLPPGVSVQPPAGFPAGQPLPGQPPNGPPGAAVNMINQLLTSPRPGGQFGTNGAPPLDQNGNPLPTTSPTPFPNTPVNGGAPGTAPPPVQGQTIGGGIAGIATKLEQSGIKVYRDRTPYNEWEFVYDITKDTTRAGGAALTSQPTAPKSTLKQ